MPGVACSSIQSEGTSRHTTAHFLPVDATFICSSCKVATRTAHDDAASVAARAQSGLEVRRLAGRGLLARTWSADPAAAPVLLPRPAMPKLRLEIAPELTAGKDIACNYDEEGAPAEDDAWKTLSSPIGNPARPKRRARLKSKHWQLAAEGAPSIVPAQSERAEGELHVCLKKCVVRQGAGLDSAQLGMLTPGDVVKVLETQELDTGSLRCRTAHGWTSLKGKDGGWLLARADDEEARKSLVLSAFSLASPGHREGDSMLVRDTAAQAARIEKTRQLTGAVSLTNRLETYKKRKTDELRPVKEENRRSEGENWIGSWRDGMNSRGYPKLSIKGCYNWFTGALLPDFLFASIPVRCASPSQSGPRFVLITVLFIVSSATHLELATHLQAPNPVLFASQAACAPAVHTNQVGLTVHVIHTKHCHHP